MIWIVLFVILICSVLWLVFEYIAIVLMPMRRVVLMIWYAILFWLVIRIFLNMVFFVSRGVVTPLRAAHVAVSV